MTRSRRTPRQLVQLCYGGIALGFVSFLLFYCLALQHALKWTLLVPVLLLIAGGVLCWQAHRELRLGVLGDLWTEDELQAGYKAVRSKWTTACIFISTGLYLVLSGVYLFERHPHHMATPVIFLPLVQWPALMMNSLTRLLKPQSEHSAFATKPLLPAELPRLRSEHWGELPARSF